ncbi:DUF418 domain-containing protein [Adhaeribacter sp. BT258]|uniref:DUF418 domain-containing protein n=1 Tax=Adhaeribacter terrigena TaxID=2793070 RepID=A0ABS1BXX8_9BACT|nr:DUF418 domain-containing protein [Adhaeribacter terrigena]MBK0401940.1 DUF418 domain-containing protein [Adhaeribacter terrigena]
MHSPQLASQRLPAPDLIRGIALVGIGAENILSFNAANEHIALFAASFPEPVSQALLSVFMLFFRGKFYPVFALLFGFATAFSFAQRGHKPFFRRSLFIALLGLTQLVFIWNGDVLLQYALLGLLLFSLKDLPDRILLSLSAILFLLSFLPAGFLPPNPTVFSGIPPEVYAKGSFLTLLRYRLPEFLHGLASPEFLLFLARIFAFMILGFFLGRNQKFKQWLQFSTVSRYFIIGLLSFMVCGALLQFSGLRGEAIRPAHLEVIKAIILALFFLANVSLFVLVPLLLFLRFPAMRFWQLYIAAGRLTLSHYLFQNLLFSFVFYGYGLRFYLQVPPLQLWLAYGLLMLMQALVSVWWLRNFKLGPVEKALRKFAYDHK